MLTDPIRQKSARQGAVSLSTQAPSALQKQDKLGYQLRSFCLCFLQIPINFKTNQYQDSTFGLSIQSQDTHTKTISWLMLYV